MIKAINQKYLLTEMRDIIEHVFELGKTTKKQPLYPTPSGMNIKVPQNPFLDTTNVAMCRARKDAACDSVFAPIPDGYTKDGGIGFFSKEIKDKDIILEIQKPPKKDPKDRLGLCSVDEEEMRQYLDNRVKIGELITPPHFYRKQLQLEPHYYIDELWSQGKNTGTNAIKDVVMQSLDDPQTQGRVLLNACCIDGKTDPTGFYYKLGFRSTNPYTNNECAKWLAEGGKRENAPCMGGTMYLPRENIQHCLNYGLDIKG